jgi:hypothetical protein
MKISHGFDILGGIKDAMGGEKQQNYAPGSPPLPGCTLFSL